MIDAPISDILEKDLRRWFKEKWVDVSRKNKDGSHPPCGRDEAKTDSKGYPKCRPSKKVSSKTPKTTRGMSQSDKKAATRRKRSKPQGVGGKPTMVKAFACDCETCGLLSKAMLSKAKAGPLCDHCGSRENSWHHKNVCGHGPKLGMSNEQFESTLKSAVLSKAKSDKPFHGYNPNRHSRKGGLNAKGRAKFKRETGANLKPPVSQKPSTLKPGSKKAKRRKSFCARMSGVKGPTSKGGKLTPKGAALKRWNC